MPIGAFQGGLYGRNAFAAHTMAEADALADRLGLQAGQTVVDVGCGNGRHLHALAQRGIHGVGVDVSPELVEAARSATSPSAVGVVRFVVGDARRLGEVDGVPRGTADVAWSLCQGGFGTSPASDPAVLEGLVGIVKPGGYVVFTAFHALFAARHLVAGDAFDTVHLTHHQVGEVRGPDDTRADFDLWTAAYTVRDVVRMAEALELEVIEVAGCEPGRYGGEGVGLDDPELLVVCRR